MGFGNETGKADGSIHFQILPAEEKSADGLNDFSSAAEKEIRQTDYSLTLVRY